MSLRWQTSLLPPKPPGAGVGPTAVKRWADSGLLRCVRTAGGHRRFDRQDVERLIRNGAPAAAAGDWTSWIEMLTTDGSVHLVQARLFEERARQGAWHLVAASLGDLLTELGRRWAAGTLSAIEEHIASAGLQRGLASVCEIIPVASGAPRCLLASAEGDDHTLGLALAELCLAEAGWRTEWAGGRTRSTDVVDRLASGAIGMVALSASAASSDASALADEVRLVGEACRAAGVPLALGGAGAWPEAPAFGARFHALPPFYEYALGQRRRSVPASQT
jgi:methylmalonyl-CoA mutase cobalamin-binding subunit